MFVILDGPNGAGKTTLKNKFSNLAGYSTLSSPGSTELASILRPVCRGTDQWKNIDPRIQFLCFSAARIDEYLRLVHNNENVVVADRWWTSTYVYQCILQGFEVPFLEFTIHPKEKIDFVFILSAKSDVLISRVEKERKQNPNHKVCSWTKEHDTIKQIQSIYENKLPKYLTQRNIEHELVDTEDLDEYALFEKIKNRIESLKKTT